MPRTKITRNAVNNKRVRDNAAELEEITRDFEIEAESLIQMLQSEHNKAMRQIDLAFDELKSRIPEHILSMRIGDVKFMKDFDEILIDEKMCNLNMTVKDTVMKGDEEEVSMRSQVTSGSESEGGKKSFHQNISMVGSLKKIQSRRRSKSVSNLNSATTPGPRALMSAAKGRTPINQQQMVPHSSRSKYRTPLNNNLVRQKAVSADRIYAITPKVNPSNPVSLLRHARAGEAVFSLTGSPIVASNVCEQTANVNIPVANGILSIRPQTMDPTNLDASLIHKIDHHTFNHLRTLKANLDIIMAGFNKKFHH